MFLQGCWVQGLVGKLELRLEVCSSDLGQDHFEDPPPSPTSSSFARGENSGLCETLDSLVGGSHKSSPAAPSVKVDTNDTLFLHLSSIAFCFLPPNDPSHSDFISLGGDEESRGGVLPDISPRCTDGMNPKLANVGQYWCLRVRERCSDAVLEMWGGRMISNPCSRVLEAVMGIGREQTKI